MKNKWSEKFMALCDSGKPWYVFLAIFSLLLAAAALVEAFTDQHMKWWTWALDIIGILDSIVHILRCKLQQTNSAEADTE